MKKAKKQLTLTSLAKIIEQGFVNSNKRFASIDHQLVQLLGETTYTRNEVEKLRSEMNQKFEGVDKQFEGVNKRFGTNDDTHQEILQAVEEITDRKFENRIKNLENRVYARQ